MSAVSDIYPHANGTMESKIWEKDDRASINDALDGVEHVLSAEIHGWLQKDFLTERNWVGRVRACVPKIPAGMNLYPAA